MLPWDLTLPHQNQQRIIPLHVSFTVLLSPKATSRQSEYPAYCAGVVGLIWGLEKCLPPPSASSILCAFIAGAGNCLSLQSVVAARLLCMLCCRGSSVDASWAAATASWFEVKPWRCSLVPGVALSARTFSSPCLYRPLFRLSPYSCVVVVVPPPQLFLPVDFEDTCRWGTRRHRAVLIEPSLCLVTAVCRGTETWEGIQAALESPTGSITWELNKTETYRVPRLGSLLSLVSRTSTRD